MARMAKMTENGLKWLEMVGNGWKHLKMTGNMMAFSQF